ncbi:transcriptional corepressor SEUSS-like [Vicia villosa]|uniref:transcriptional corepressor SEUSS-like n=1 Tax=Vicia villosa TaxID=3911 RepID=UPI00273BBA02|nr:transcriptional corepressor SEUSS-like [Vicia villosa]XP_058786850.1 transcriptional corepressor SEUSS-like [Vicia villosa]
MVPPGPGPSPPIGGGPQSLSPSLMRTHSGVMGSQGAPMSLQTSFPSLVSPRTQFGNMNILGNMSNMTSMLNQSFSNGVPNHGSSQRGGIETGAEAGQLSSVGNGMSFGSSPSSYVQGNMANAGSSGQVQGQQFSNPSINQLLPDHQHSQHLDPQNFQHSQQSMQQFSSLNTQQQQHYQSMRGGIGGSGMGPVKLEPQVNNDQLGQQQLQSMRNLPPVKLEQQQIQTMRTLAPVKMEPQHCDQPSFLQQQQFLHMSRQSSQAAAAQINLLNHHRLLQLQQQQQQLLKSMPQQRSQLPQQFQQQNMPARSPVKPAYEPGMCARRLTHYMYQQKHRPEDNNIEFWRKFVAEYFAPNAKKKWCVSMYGSSRQTTGVFPQDVWHCEICNHKPGRGFEATVEVLPRLFKVKYDSGTLEELLYVDMPREYHNSSGQIVLDYAKAIQESVFEQLRVVRDGQLRIVFSPDLKICSWEFCARRHEELIPRKLLIPQISQIGAVAQKYQALTQNATPNISAPELQNNCNMFVASARQLAKTLEVPLVNDLGYSKTYVRCLQISEVVNSLKDLMDYSKDTVTGPMESLAKFPRRTVNSCGVRNQAQQHEDQLKLQQQQQQQQMMVYNSNGDQNPVQAAAMQIASSNGMVSVNSSVNSASASTTTSTIVGLLHQNSVNSRQNTMNNASSPYGGCSVQIPSPGSSSTVPQAQPNSSPFQSPPTPSSSNNPPQTPRSTLTPPNQMNTTNSIANVSLQQQHQYQSSLSGDADPSDPHSSVHKIIQEMMMSSQMNGTGGMAGAGSLGNDMKNGSNNLPMSTNTGLNNGNGTLNNNPGAGSYGTMGFGQSTMPNGMRAAMVNNSIMNGRGGMPSIARDQAMNHQQDLSNQLLSGLGAANGFNNHQFD